MRGIPAEFTTTKAGTPNSYGDSGCMLSKLDASPSVLRHEHYNGEHRQTIYLFAREPELKVGAQIFIYLYPMPTGGAEYEEMRNVYLEQQKDFKLPAGQTFEPNFLAPAVCDGFAEHTAFRAKDGLIRRRIVHFLTGQHRSVILVYSLSSIGFKDSAFFGSVCQNLTLADVELDAPFTGR